MNVGLDTAEIVVAGSSNYVSDNVLDQSVSIETQVDKSHVGRKQTNKSKVAMVNEIMRKDLCDQEVMTESFSWTSRSVVQINKNHGSSNHFETEQELLTPTVTE